MHVDWPHALSRLLLVFDRRPQPTHHRTRPARANRRSLTRARVAPSKVAERGDEGDPRPQPRSNLHDARFFPHYGLPPDRALLPPPPETGSRLPTRPFLDGN